MHPHIHFYPNYTAAYASYKATIISNFCQAAASHEPLCHLDISSAFTALNTIYTNQCMNINYHNLMAQFTRQRSPSVFSDLTCSVLNRRPTYTLKACPSICSTTTTWLLNLTLVSSPKLRTPALSPQSLPLTTSSSQHPPSN